MTPDEAALIRDTMLRLVTLHAAAMPGRVVWAPDIRHAIAHGAHQMGADIAARSWIAISAHVARTATMALAQADIILWRCDLWNAAVAGAEEAFTGVKLDETLVPVRPAFWTWTTTGDPDERHTVLRPADLEYPRPVALIGSLVMRLGDGPLARRVVMVDVSAELDGGMPWLGVQIEMGIDSEALPYETGLLGALSFLQERIAVYEDTPPRRIVRRRLEKEGRPVPTVRTVVLRRERGPGRDADEVSDREYAHQWLVSGHWRRLHEPRKADGKLVTYVRPHVKGPEGAPMMPPRANVFRVHR